MCAMTEWQPPPHELPDLRHVDNNTIAIDIETLDRGLQAERGSSWPWRDGHICGVSVAWRASGVMRALYAPMRHRASNNFSPIKVHSWIRDHVAASVRFVTMNGNYDWGWLHAEGGIIMPASPLLEEIGALAALVDESQFEYSLDAICARHGLPGKETALLEEACKAAGFKITKKTAAQSYIWQLPATVCGPYCEADAINTLLLYETLIPIIRQEDTYDAYRLECDLMPVTIAMRRQGVRVDRSAAEQARDQLLAKRDAALAELSAQHSAQIGMDEINSSKWKIATFDRYDIISPHTTATGRPSFAAGKKGWMGSHEHWLPRLIAIASKYDAAACKFLQGHILDHIINGRIYSEIHQFRSEDGGAKSLRFSYSDPPLQQMPIRDPEIGQLIRHAFLPEPG
jgi:DNA polymerase I-like protein with 3'-5' exonuclease and polymerase domains